MGSSAECLETVTGCCSTEKALRESLVELWKQDGIPGHHSRGHRSSEATNRHVVEACFDPLVLLVIKSRFFPFVPTSEEIEVTMVTPRHMCMHMIDRRW